MDDRKKAEAAERRISEERYRSLMQHTSEGFYLFETPEPVPVDLPVDEQIMLVYQGRVVECNEALAGMYGYATAEEVLGKTLADLHGGTDNPENIEFLRASIENGYRLEGAISSEQTRDGTPRWFSNNVIGIVENGHLVRIWGTQIDVTDMMLTEEALRSEKEFTDTALNAQSDTFFLFETSSGQALKWNLAFREISGYTDEEIKRLPAPASYYGPEDLERIMDFTEQILESGSGTIEAELICKDGRKVPTEYRVAVIADAEGTANYIISIGRDITDRRLAQDKLRQERDIAEQVVNSLPGAFYMFDTEGNMHRWNKNLSLVTGYSNREIARMKALDFFADEDKQTVIDGIQEVYIRGESTVEAPFRTKQGERIPYFLTGTKMELEGANHLVGMGVDISERKQLEEQYRQSQKMEAVGQLAGGVAHDFNNLLTVINNYADFAIEELQDGDPMKADIQQIQKAGQRAEALTRQLLAFSRKQVMEPQILDLNLVVADLQKMLRRLIGEDIDLRTELAADLGRVNSDPGQIEQVLMNLALNARDAMPQGGELTIVTRNARLDASYAALHTDMKPGPYVVLAVTDGGVGIDTELRERIFEPFFTTKGKGQGTGLGLATAYGIIKQSGGTIRVESQPGRGTTFEVYLPRIDASGTTRAQEPTGGNLQGTENVLIVEDEQAVRELAERILTSAGYRVATAADGGEAVLACKSPGAEFELMLTDVVMPQMSGKGLADRLADLRPGLKVLYMSGYTDNAIAQHGVLEEGTHFIAKPFLRQELLAKVRWVLDEGR